jgi:hypothetical protein
MVIVWLKLLLFFQAGGSDYLFLLLFLLFLFVFISHLSQDSALEHLERFNKHAYSYA